MVRAIDAPAWSLAVGVSEPTLLTTPYRVLVDNLPAILITERFLRHAGIRS